MAHLSKEELLNLKPGDIIQSVHRYFDASKRKVISIEKNVLRLEDKLGKKSRLTINKSFSKDGIQTTYPSNYKTIVLYFLVK